jgi:DNA-binding transcriptional ArsR family regulator
MDTFYALAEPTRRRILEMLANKGQLSSSDISKKFNVTAQAISQHLKVLRDANLVYVKKLAQQRIYRLNPDHILEVEKWAKHTTEIWEERFDALDRVLEEEKRKAHNKKGNKNGE